MNKKILGVGIGIAVIIAISAGVLSIPSSEVTPQKTNEKIGLVINSPNQATTLQELDEIYSTASESGIGRSNVYLFWNLIEPERGEFNWQYSDALMSFNKKNNLKVTLYFSIINGETLGPFPNWIGKPPIQSLGEDRVVSVLDAILSRYNIIDTVILAGQTESQFRYHEQNIPAYKELFTGVYDEIKEKHPDVKIGNSFALHQVLNKNLKYIVTDLAIGDFVAFSYFPVDTLYEMVKTPQQAKDELTEIFDLAGDKKAGIFEISWSTSDFVGGNQDSQLEFLEKSFEFYTENESELEFFTWYRQNDKPEGTCTFEVQDIGESKLEVEGSGFGSSEHVIERLNHYVCSAGLFDENGNPKPSWSEFKNQIQMIN
ncbi:hypothetical protein [Nitrosopumilus piranensis]|uniref:Glycoside hydrolase family 42 N-terminal domain-containing protein n=1 Tax=Nitrosopumilus piranensis TaxID=1582439 RepID=A0A0C5C8V5_9ARCH|nr:hypothetical protein [Nitrosopumilus piranensis]AJM91642.1 conserved exported protein of unknown function [Nitrosopumilus piranensis]